MQPNLKKILRALSLDLRHTLEGFYDNSGIFHPGDLEIRLNALGVWRERAAKPLEELPYLSIEDKAARQVIDAYIVYRAEAEVSRAEAVAEFVRESAYNWANRLLALRCMEARGIIDEVILEKEIYGGRSLVHNRLARKNPEACAGPDDGLFAILFQEFEERARELPELFAPKSPAITLRPSLPALKRCLGLLSGTEKPSGQEAATDEVFSAQDALGWAYQYWNSEEKDRVFEKVRTQKGAKIEGADIIPATQLYTEPYMVKFLVQNSLGSIWMGMHPDSKNIEGWEYYVKDADRAPVEIKSIEEITLLDPACGSGHFHLEAFDLFFPMYQEEHGTWSEEQIVAAILNYNLYGIDIDERAVQIAAAALWMKAKEYAPNLQPDALNGFHQHLVATNIHLPKGKNHLKAFLTKHPESTPLQPALEAIFEGLENVHELGSLVQIEEPVEKELRYLKTQYEANLGKPEQLSLLPETKEPRKGELPPGVESYDEWKANTIGDLEIHFAEESQVAGATQSFFGVSACKGLALFEALSRRYVVVTANPPYMGSKNMGPVLKKYIGINYKPGKRDLYSAFIIRCTYLCKISGAIGLLTLHTFLTSRAFDALRREIHSNTIINTLAHLGKGTMKSLSNPNAQGFCMYVLQKNNLSTDKKGIFIRLVDCVDKNKSLLEALRMNSSGRIYKRSSITFSKLREGQIIYWVGESLIGLLASTNTLGKYAQVPKGLSTGDNNRFLRFYWEVDNSEQWKNYAKGGGYRKWYGLGWFSLNWANEGFLIRNLQDQTGYIRSRVQNEKYYQLPGYTYTEMANASFGVRTLDELEFFDARSPGIFPFDSAPLSILAILNSRVITFLYRCLSPGVMLDQAYGPDLPMCNEINNLVISTLTEDVLRLKKRYTSLDIQDRSFSGFPARETLLSASTGALLAILHTFEGELESKVFNLYDLDRESKQQILGETGIPAGWFPLIANYDKLPLLVDYDYESFDEMNSSLRVHKRSIPSFNDYKNIKNLLRMLYEAGPEGKVDAFEENLNIEDGEDEVASGAKIPIPAETFLEDLSQKTKIHPISVYWMLREGIEQEHWRCLPEEKRIARDNFTVLILRLLGHRWPKQIEAGEPVPDWANLDGIIPLIPGLSKPSLLERVRRRLPEEFPGRNAAALDGEFEEILGENLEKWLGSSFFKHHISQFKKRPIAWQINSHATNASGGKGKKKGLDKAPAFACLVYYHKLDHNTLTTLQSQYVRPLRQSYETELRTLDNSAFLTPDQSSRRLQLEAWIDELKDFEGRLEQCEREGFASPLLKEIAEKESLDRWTSRDGKTMHPLDSAEFEGQEMRYDPDINDGVRVNIAPLQKYGLLAADVLDVKDIEKAISDRAEWRTDERRWCRDGKLPQPGWWK